MSSQAWKIGSVLAILLATPHLFAREKDPTQYGMGLIVNLPLSEDVVTPVVEDVVQNGIVRGTKEYNQDEYVTGATPASSTRAFPEWKDGGKVFFKLRNKALDPRNFKDSNDSGTIVVRYVVQPQGDNKTILRIDAVFVEDSRRISHASNGSVESAEYKDIHDRLEALEAMKAQTIEAEKEKQGQRAKAAGSASILEISSFKQQDPERAGPEPDARAQNVPEDLVGLVQALRREVERVVKAPGAPLKSAPFHNATNLASLAPGTEVLIVITSPYWLGIETHDGQHGWILRDELELLP